MENNKSFEKEQEALEKITDLCIKIILDLKGKDLTDEELYIYCCLIHILKLSKAIVILYENNLFEAGQSLLRNIYDITFKCVALLKDNTLFNNYIEKFYKEKKKLLENIKSEKAFEYLSEEKVEQEIINANNKLSGLNVFSENALAKKANLSKEYIHYRLLCDYTHFDIGVIQSLIEETPKGIFLNPNPICIDIHKEYGLLIGALQYSVKEIIEYINDKALKEEYAQISALCDSIW